MIAKTPHSDLDPPFDFSIPGLTETAKQHYATVGVVASGWAGFEFFLDSSALELGRVPLQAGLCFTSQVIGSSRKLDAYIAIARLRGADKFMGELDKFAKETVKLSERRNRIVHDPWRVLTAGGLPYRLETTAKKKLRHGYVAVSAPEMQKLISDTERHITQFLVIHGRIKAAVNISNSP